MKAASWRGILWVLLGAVLWSTGGVAVKWLPLPGLFVSAARSVLAALLFLAIARGRVWPKAGARLWFAVGACAYAYVVTSFVLSTRWTTAANAIILQYTAPFWVVLLSKPLLGESPRRSDIIGLLIGAVGVVFCFRDGFSLGAGGTRLLGDIVALSSGLLFGVSMIVMRRVNRGAHGGEHADEGGSLGFLFTGNLLAAVIGAGLLGAGMQGGMPAVANAPWSAVVVVALVWLGVFQLGGGYLTVQHGLRTVPATQASVLTLVEPVLNPVWVALVVREVPGTDTLIGGALVIAGMVVGLMGRRS